MKVLQISDEEIFINGKKEKIEEVIKINGEIFYKLYLDNTVVLLKGGTVPQLYPDFSDEEE